MAANQQQRKRRRRRSRHGPGRVYLILTCAVICAAVILALTVFFKINRVAVEGNTHYTEGEILEVVSVSTGDNLFFVKSEEVSREILDKLPYVKSVKINRKLPDTLVLSITESTPAAAVQSKGYRWLIDEDGKVLDSAPMAESSTFEGYTQVSGLNLTDPQVGKKLKSDSEDADRLTPALEILASLREEELLSQVKNMQISKSFAVQLSYGELYVVKFQLPCDIPAKIQFLQAGLQKLEADETGVIDLTVDKTFRFIPQSVMDMQKDLELPDMDEEEPEEEGDNTEPPEST